MGPKTNRGGIATPPGAKQKAIDEWKKAQSTGNLPTFQVLADKFGVHPSTIGNWLEAAGVHTKAPRSSTREKGSRKGSVHPNLAKARAVHADRLRNDPEYKAAYAAKLKAGKAMAKQARESIALPEQTMLSFPSEPQPSNAIITTRGEALRSDRDEREIEYLRESLRVALREREALRVTLDIMQREQQEASRGNHGNR